jgi:FkbM family methyltransferase
MLSPQKNLSVDIVEQTIPKIIHFSVPNKPSPQQLEIIELARAMHPKWTIRVWNDDAEFPESPLHSYLRKCKSGAQFADLIRLEAVFKEGGIYLDSDMRVLRPLDTLAESTSFIIASEDGYNLTNACFGATPRHPALGSIIDFLADNEPDWDLPPNVTTGPMLFSKLLRWRSDIAVYPREIFYPYHHFHKVRKPHELSYCEHLWAGSWTSGWTWTAFGYARANTEEMKAKPNVREAVANLMRRAVRPIFDTIGRAVERHRVKPLPSYPVAAKVVVSTIHGHQLVTSGYDYSLTPRLVRDGYFELASERFVAKTLAGGDWFIDVGANIGLFSLLAAGKCGLFGRVFAFEPNPAMAELLKESAALNYCHDRIVVKEIAISNKPGKTKLHVVGARAGDARLVNELTEFALETQGAFAKTREYLPGEAIIDIEMDRLDDLFPVDVPIKILKIDAEGHEANVLAGAERLLRAKAFDYIMIEAIMDVGAREWTSTSVWLLKLISFGYHVCTADTDGSLIEHPSLGIALSRMSENNLIFAARGP